MAAVVMIVPNGGNTIAASLTRYAPISETRQDNTYAATETERQTTYRHAGIFSRFYVRISANGITATTTIRTRVNAANGNQSVSIGSGATGDFEDNTNIDIIAAGDEVNIQIVTGGSGTTITPRIVVTRFEATDTRDTVKKFQISDTATRGASVTVYPSMTGASGGTNETNNSFEVNTAGTLRNFQLNVTANSRSDSTTERTRVNAANGAQSISVGAGVTGILEDTTNTDTLAVDDDICYQIVTGAGTGTITTLLTSCDFETTNNTFQFIGSSSVGASLPANSTEYIFPGGHCVSNPTENIRETMARMDYTLSNFFLYVSANGLSNAATLTVRVANVDTTITVSVGAGATGQFEDDTHTADVIASQKVSYKYVGVAGGTNMTANQIGTLATVKIKDLILGMGLIPFLR